MDVERMDGMDGNPKTEIGRIGFRRLMGRVEVRLHSRFLLIGRGIFI
jgi:hypothetical protein